MLALGPPLFLSLFAVHTTLPDLYLELLLFDLLGLGGSRAVRGGSLRVQVSWILMRRKLLRAMGETVEGTGRASLLPGLDDREHHRFSSFERTRHD